MESIWKYKVLDSHWTRLDHIEEIQKRFKWQILLCWREEVNAQITKNNESLQSDHSNNEFSIFYILDNFFDVARFIVYFKKALFNFFSSCSLS